MLFFLKEKTRLALAALILPAVLFAQQPTATVAGRITDGSNDQPVELVTVFIKGTSNATTSDERGYFAIQVPANERVMLVFRRVAYKESSSGVLPLSPGARFVLDVALAPTESDMEVTIRERRLDEGGMLKEKNIRELRRLPSASGKSLTSESTRTTAAGSPPDST